MPDAKESSTTISFGPFQVDFVLQEVRKHGVRLHVPRQSFQILRMLLDRPGELVTREELRSTLWPADTFVDFDHGLNTAVRRLRDALGDTAESPNFIETLPRLGYRFIANVPTVEEPAAACADAPQSAERRTWLLVVAALSVALAGVLAFESRDIRSRLFTRTGTPPQIHSLAVLPFTNLSISPEQEYFADAMTEALITELSRLNPLKVTSRTSVMQYKQEQKRSLSQIGEELRVDAVMEGSVLRSGDRVRIVVHLIYVPADQTLMVETYERDLTDILKLQTEIAEAVAQKVRLNLTPEQQQRLRHAKEVNPKAYELYLYGTRLADPTFNGLQRAMQQFKKSIELDDGYAPAYIALGDVYASLGEYRWLPPRESFPQAGLLFHQALKLDEQDCNAHRMLAGVHWRYDWDWQATEREYATALSACPNSIDAHWYYAVYLAWRGLKDEAFNELAKSRELDPVQEEPLGGRSVINYQLRDYQALLEAARLYVTRNPNLWISHYYLGVALQGLRQTQEAVPEYQKAVELSQRDSDTLAAIGYAFAVTGRRSDARAIIRNWDLQSKTRYVSPYMIAVIYAGLHEKDKAFEYLEKAYQERSPDLPWFLPSDLRLDSLRSDARFHDLMQRMNFPRRPATSRDDSWVPGSQ